MAVYLSDEPEVFPLEHPKLLSCLEAEVYEEEGEAELVKQEEGTVPFHLIENLARETQGVD